MSYLDVARACDRWLARNIPQYVPGGMWGKRFKHERPEQLDMTPASTNKGSIRVERDPVQRKSRAKYATAEERREAIRQAQLSRWEKMTPEEKKARIAHIQSGKGQKSSVPRHLRPEWKEYKRKWDAKNRKKPLTKQQIQKRREDARRRYNAVDPAIRRVKIQARREKLNAKRKAEKEKGLQVS